jgi:hypothetical protein
MQPFWSILTLPPHSAKVIGIPTYDRPDVYTVLFANGSIAEYSDSNNILELAPVQQSTASLNLLPSWINDGANATIFLSDMSKPRHGKLRIDANNQWNFTPGNSTDFSQGILL